MNTAVGITHKLDDWQDDVSSWAPPMFTASFGENVPPIPDSHFWENSGNSSEYFRANLQAAREGLRHDFDSAENFGSGYTIDNAAPESKLGCGQNAPSYDRHQHQAPRTSSMWENRQLNDPFVPQRNQYDEDADDDAQAFQADEDKLFDDNSLTSSTITTASKHHSASPEAMRSSSSATSPTAGAWAGGDWGGSEQSPSNTTTANPNATIVADKTAGTITTPPGKGKRNRERNRMAAHKCRQKAKQSMTVLQERERELGHQNRLLQEHAGSLREEILDLKNEILRHSDCNSDIIQNYIARAARDVN
ncbi:hypothetical protein F4804DRAFT_5344 [Jackrogersella minutella]|nr:hypothetical protein F4804DRAFT_5344 [Jackrogersella minutella]